METVMDFIKITAYPCCGCCETEMLFKSYDSAKETFLKLGLGHFDITDDSGETHKSINTFRGFHLKKEEGHYDKLSRIQSTFSQLLKKYDHFNSLDRSGFKNSQRDIIIEKFIKPKIKETYKELMSILSEKSDIDEIKNQLETYKDLKFD